MDLIREIAGFIQVDIDYILSKGGIDREELLTITTSNIKKVI